MSCGAQKFVESGASHNFVLVNIEGNTDPCSAFNEKHKLTLPHFGLKNKGDIAPFGVKFIPHHVAVGVMTTLATPVCPF